MDSEFVNAFMDGTIETFEMMCDEKPERCGPLALSDSAIQTYEFFATIGLSGPFKAAYAITMETEVALKAASAFSGDDVTELDEEALDALGELINIVAGAAAANFELPLNLSLPTVLLAKKRIQYASQGTPWLVIPMRFPNWGEFRIELTQESQS